MAQQKGDDQTGSLLDQPVEPNRFYVSKLGVMRLVVDKGTQICYQVVPKDAAAMCKLLNELDLRSKL